MQVRAHLKNLRMSPRKVRLVADTVRGLDVDIAMSQLSFDLRHGAPVVKKLIESARASAKHNHDHNGKGLHISEIQVGEGPTLKRFRARAYGRAAKILKRTSKITVILSDETAVHKVKKNVKSPRKPSQKSPTKQLAQKSRAATPTKNTTDVDDLTKIEGIGPKISETLVSAGVATFAELAKKKPTEISEIISDVRGSHITDTWPRQAELARDGKWEELEKWQDELNGGKA